MRLWGENEDLPSNAYSIRNTESFNKYFTLQFQLSNEEIDKLVAANDFDAFEKISEEKGVEFNYLWNIIKHNFETNHFDNEQKKSFLNVVLTICYHDNEFNIGQDIDLIYQIEKNRLDYLKEFFDIIVKDYKVIKRLNDSISSYKDAEEEARLVKRAKLRLMEQGMSEEESYKYILKTAMQKRITKKELALAILHE
jgi:hypothetical protein